MNNQEKEYFEALSADRADSAKILEKPSMRGVKKSVVDKYSDQAHFIYELLQNADDALATSVRFVLEPSRLIFAHNGKRLFSVSDPLTEDDDTENGCLGDINAITSIANSNKTEASIGKFGVGFKAVFQYTSTPHIYDPNCKFKIERFIVPVELENDFPGRKPDETLFVFPFDHNEKSENEAFDDISDKLLSLSYPLLFLSHLKEIEFEFADTIGLYSKRVEKELIFDDTIAEYISLLQNNGDEIYEEKLWLFSRSDENERRYSVGFFTDGNEHLRPVSEPAFCFFPTKEVTGLNFIIHAAFLLTDSREGIRAGIEYNDLLIKALSNLAADSLIYLKKIGDSNSIRLIDDSIVDIIPYDPEQFSNPLDKRKVSFKPFYNSIKFILSLEELLPSSVGYVDSKNAYWASVSQIPQLFTNEQLAEISDNPSAKWIFPTLSRDEIQRNNKALFSFIDNLTRTNINEDVIISGRSRGSYYDRYLGCSVQTELVKGIDSSFIEHQSIEWLNSFYKWISESKHRTEIILNKEVFLDQNGHACAAYDDDDQHILFLPVKDIDGYTVVHPKLLENPDTKKLINDIGIKQPSLKDQIYNIILPMYKDGARIDTDPHFMMFFNYYCKCSNDEVDDFIGLIKEYKFVKYYENDVAYRGKASDLYIPLPELIMFFSSKPSTRFVALDKYKTLVGKEKEKQLISFLSELGAKNSPSIIASPDNYQDYYDTKTEYLIDGLNELITAIAENKDEALSVFLWKQLCSFESNQILYRIRNIERLSRPDGRYNFRRSYETSTTVQLLRSSAWFMNSEGQFVTPQEVDTTTLSNLYDTELEGADNLIFDYLAIREPIVNEPEEFYEEENDDDNLTDEQKEKIALANDVLALGFSIEELRKLKRQKDAAKMETELHTHQSHHQQQVNQFDTGNEEEYPSDDESYNSDIQEEKARLAPTTSKVIKDIVKRTKDKPSSPVVSKQTPDEDYDFDADEFTPVPVDYSKRIEKAKEKSAAEIDKIAYFEELQKRAIDADKYSYAWFTALLEMESINSGETNSNSREVSISFSMVEREPGTKRTLVLKHPNRYIPQFMEDLADIPLVLHIGEQTKTVAIEVANIKSYTLRVKLKNGAEIESIDLNAVTSASIDAKSPVFLLEELRRQFQSFDYEDDYNMKENLCENIRFVFGPPGTGKTTHLAKNVIIPLIQKNPKCKVLVLTPTNKSADVLVRRIMEVSGEDRSYENWLIRFGGTGDEFIEQSPVFKDKVFDIRSLSQNVTITTIARFPYDFYMPEGTRIYLNGIYWDYIIIDEASMIPIANIIYPLYKKTPKEFIIAGDPFQIEPIASVNLWQNENIYTMVNLNSFVNPSTEPHKYQIEFLKTQYRSIPEIGRLFSEFAYGGILEHFRTEESQRKLNVDNELGVKTLNIIKFPVSKYESIYRCKRLMHSSSYQVYSALFTFEYIIFLSNAIHEKNPDQKFSIGVIAPYRAQADMIDKLLASEKTPPGIDVQVGTIHGFQGDECDIIFAVFNTPPSISSSSEMFLNKRNIINVSISRARDYLFIVMPDDDTEKIANLRLVKRVESLIRTSNNWTEFTSSGLEKIMFNDEHYLENNAFSTSHQSVNVYGLPEKRYEVRTEENAVDVQIHKPIVTVEGKRLKSETTGLYSGTAIPKVEDMEILVHGRRTGQYRLVLYTGKLKDVTTKKAIQMFIPLFKKGKERLLPVSLIDDERTIYVTKANFLSFSDSFDPHNVEIRKTYTN